VFSKSLIEQLKSFTSGFKTEKSLVRTVCGNCESAGFPSPVFYGAAIDSTCLVQQTSCNRRGGACLLYDNDAFRIRLHVLPVIGKFVSTWLYCLAWFFSVRRDRLRGVDSLPLPDLSMTTNVVAADTPTAPRSASARGS